MERKTKQVVVRATGLEKRFLMGNTPIYALRGVDLTVEQGEMVAILGPSGCGKSTLLGLLGGLDKPSAGQVEIGGTDITRMNENRLADIRNRKIGFVFQFFNLIPTLTALENVELPMQFSGNGKYPPRRRAEELLSLVGLSSRLKHRPGQLSGGEQQRVAIARALVNSPNLVLADEPTGNLDSDTSAEIMELVVRLNQEQGQTFVLVTHDATVSQRAHRVIRMQDGRILNHSQGDS